MKRLIFVIASFGESDTLTLITADRKTKTALTLPRSGERPP